MKEKLKALWAKAEPIQSVLIFMAILLISNAVWKLSIYGDEEKLPVLLFNHWDISSPFEAMTIHITNISRYLLEFFNYKIHWHCTNDICFSNHNRIFIVWGCTAIKQSFIFVCIMAFTPGPWKHKLWYIPLGLLVVYLFNIFRISFIAVTVENHRDWFEFLHGTVFKYLFYGVIFLIWVFWNERFDKKRIHE